MTVLFPYLFAATFTRQVLKYVWSPRKHPREIKRDVPYEDLCVSAVLSRLAYLPKKDFGEKSLLCVRDDQILIDKVRKALAEKEDDIELYQGISKDASQNCFWGVQDTQVYVWRKDDRAYIVFRGTESKEDWLSNLDVRKRKLEFGEDKNSISLEVHNGFKNQFMSVEDRITSFLEDHKKDIKEIYFLGHSLGMACSVIAALYYHHYFSQDNLPHITIHCHNFGGPRIGSQKFAEYYAQQKELTSRTWCVRDVCDVIPMVPLSSRFYHIPCPTLCIGEDEKVEIKKKDMCSIMRPLKMLTMMNITDPISPHYIEKYIEKLKRISVRQRFHKSLHEKK